MKARRIFLSAFGIHMGGGLVLLREFARAAAGQIAVAVLDARLSAADLALFEGSEIRLVPRRLDSRVTALFRLAADACEGDVLFMFNSLPPPRRSRALTIVYVHAPHFAGLHQAVNYGWFPLLRMTLERITFRLTWSNADEIWVQTKAVTRALRGRWPTMKLRNMPFVDASLQRQLAEQQEHVRAIVPSDIGYCYPADAVAHKNHGTLFAAWAILAEEGYYPMLEVTLEQPAFYAALAEARLAPGTLVNIVNIGRQDHGDILARFNRGAALIFPSLAETFGLPILEARAAGAALVVAERDYAREVCAADESFDPKSARSIADAVRRHLGQPRRPLLPYDASRIVAELLA